MKTTALIGTIIVSLVLFLVSTTSAELTEVEQNLLREEAIKLAKEKGLGEDEMYRVFALSYLGGKSEQVSKNSTNSVKAEHERLRAAVYNSAADASLKIAMTLQQTKQLIAELEAEKATTGGKIVSTELSRRINGVGALGFDTIQTTVRMNAARVKLASYESTLGCNSKQMGYIVKCLESLRKAVGEISSAMDLLKKALEPIISVSLLSTGRHFKY